MPDWVYGQRQDGYWYGLGVIKKPFTGEDIRLAAREAAIGEIASQIRIEVSSDLTHIFVDDGNSNARYTESLISTRVNENLSNIELVDSYESQDKYYILLRLSESVYYKMIEQKRQNAVAVSRDLYNRASVGVGPQTLILLNNALDEIRPFLDESIFITNSNGEQSNLYSLIVLKISEFFDRVEIQPQSDLFRYSLGDNAQILCHATDKLTGDPIPGLSFDISYGGSKPYQTSVSSYDGQVEFKIPSDLQFNGTQYLDVYLNVSGYGLESDGVPLIRESVKVYPIRPTFSIEVDDANIEALDSLIKDALAKRFNAEFKDKGTNYIIRCSIDTRIESSKPNEWGVFVSYADLAISVFDSESDTEIYSQSVNNIKGASFISSKESENDALDKINKSIIENIMPDIISSIIRL